MKDFRKDCWVCYAAGLYGYKNGVSVIQAKKGVWIVIQHGKIVYHSSTLTDCKLYVGRYC